MDLSMYELFGYKLELPSFLYCSYYYFVKFENNRIILTCLNGRRELSMSDGWTDQPNMWKGPAFYNENI